MSYVFKISASKFLISNTASNLIHFKRSQVHVGFPLLFYWTILHNTHFTQIPKKITTVKSCELKLDTFRTKRN